LVTGALNASLLFHLAVLSLAVMLSQSLLPKAMNRSVVVRLYGAVMIGAGVIVGFRQDTEPIRQAMALVGYAGVALWLEPVWRPSISSAHQGFTPPAHHKVMQVCSLLSAVGASGVLAWNSPAGASIAAIGAGATLATASVVFSRRSRRLLLVGAVLTIAGLLGAAGTMSLPDPLPFSGPLLGSGEEAFVENTTEQLRAVSARDSGVRVLFRTVGAPGAVLTIVGLLGSLMMFLVHSRRDHPGDKARCVAWTVASLLSAGAFLGPGGMFMPAVLLAIGLTWGIAAEATGRASPPRPGVTVLVILASVMVLTGIARSTGLLVWSTYSLGPEGGMDKVLHAVFGMMLAMTMAWLTGSKKLIRGLGGIALACLAGGVGEVIQYLTITGRSVEWSDWGAHVAGCLAATACYLLCIGSMHCESPDATGGNHRVNDPYST